MAAKFLIIYEIRKCIRVQKQSFCVFLAYNGNDRSEARKSVTHDAPEGQADECQRQSHLPKKGNFQYVVVCDSDASLSLA